MASPSASRPSRPNQPPSRHSIAGTSLDPRLKQPGPPLRSNHHHLTPPRAKLKHASTTPSALMPGTEAAHGLGSNSLHACHNCHQMDTRFYCDPCLSSRLEAHHKEMRRLTLARDKAKAAVQNVLFQQSESSTSAAAAVSPSQVTPPSAALPDPFDTNAAEPTSSADARLNTVPLHTLIQLRAQRAAIISRVQNIHQCISESQQAHLQAKELLKEQKAHIVLRKQNLAKAWSGLEGSSATSSSSPASQRSRREAKSRWLAHPAADHIDLPLVYTDVYTHYERQSDEVDSSADPADQQLGATLTRARLSLAALQAEAAAVSTQLAATRAALARQAFGLYAVAAPISSSSKGSSSFRTKQVDLSASSSVAQRISRLSERYIPGAFGLGHTPALPVASHTRNAESDGKSRSRQTGDSSPSSPSLSSSNNWSISSLALPLPSEAKRYPRENVNGAVTYAANLIQLLANYLGVALPFSIEQHKGRLAIRPDALWDGGGGSSAKTLYLSSSAYAHLTATNSTAVKLNNLAESTIGLGASTLSTIESYIHLPSGPWGLASNVASSPKPDEPSKGKSEAAKSFISALVMLCYNVAYLATKQGIQLDLVGAASNPLSLVSKLVQQKELGRVAHSNHIPGTGIQDLSLGWLDFDQLGQILEPSTNNGDGGKRGSSGRNTVGGGKGGGKIMETSYVDVGEAAASVMNIKDPTAIKPQSQPDRKEARKLGSEQNVAPTKPRSAQSGLQKHQVRHTPPITSPPSLDFLRRRGQDVTKAKKPSAAVEKAGPGAVIFNGVEVGVRVGIGTGRGGGTGRSGKARKEVASAEEGEGEGGWDLV